MGNFANNALTDSGRALLADVQSGAVLIPTKIVIGSGEMPSTKTPATMTGVVAPVSNLAITKKKRTADGKCIIGGVYTNKDVTSAFYYRELALYARAEYRDEAGNVVQSVPECLYTYGNSGDTADYMPAYSTGAIVEKQIDLVIWVGSEAEVDVSLASGVYVYEEDFNAHVDDTSLHNYAAVASSSDGVAYTATIEGITELREGLIVIMVPQRDSNSQTPTLNINGLGAKGIRRPGSANSTAAYGGIEANWLRANYAVMLLYSGGNWICQGMTKVRGDDLYGHVPISSGGTGATTAPQALANLGAVSKAGDKLTGDLTIEKALPTLVLQSIADYAMRLFKNANAENDFGTVLRDISGDKVVDLMMSAVTGALMFKVNGTEYPVFTAKNPPTPSQVGAVAKIGDTMTGQLTFDTPGLFSAFAKKRTIGTTDYIMRVGVGSYGDGATVSLRLATVAADGAETITGQFDMDNTGVYWTPNGGTRRTIAHSGNLGLLTASVG